MLTHDDYAALWLSARLAGVTTVVLLLLGTPLAWWLARGRSRWRVLVEVGVALPLVLPPTVLGFYLLFALGPDGPIGGLWESLGGARLVFSFPGLVIGSTLFSLPFVVQPLTNAFSSLGRAELEAAASLRAGPVDRFFSVVLPMTRSAFFTAATLGFAHTVGEFGVVLMISGDIPGSTRVVSIAIYDYVERVQYERAHVLAGILLAFSFVVLLAVRLVGRQGEARLR